MLFSYPAVPGEDFLATLQEAGFENAELVAETGFNSSPKTITLAIIIPGEDLLFFQLEILSLEQQQHLQ